MTDLEILSKDQDWTEKRHLVREALGRNLPGLFVQVSGDNIEVKQTSESRVPVAVVEAVSPSEYRIKTNDAGHPRQIVGGGRPVAAENLISELRAQLKRQGA